MSAEKLMEKVISYGVSENDIRDRFMGNNEFYAACFEGFIFEPNVGRLKGAMEKKDYANALEAAHALKGLSGNLGLSAYYEAARSLVESLRTASYETVDEEYTALEQQYHILKAFLSEEVLQEDSASITGKNQTAGGTGPAASASSPKKRITKRRLFIPVIVLALLLIAAFVFLLFSQLMSDYKENVIIESTNHLVEINYQIKQSVESRVESDWLVTYTVAAYIAESNDVENDEGIRSLMKKIRDLWKISNIILYTESGYNINADGETTANDLASERIGKARKAGEYMTIIDSDITYTVPVETSLTYAGSRIVAVSVVKSMKSFLDDMDFSSFGDYAYMYLSDNTGRVISRLTNSAAATTFNVLSLFDEEIRTTISNQSVDPNDLLAVEAPTAFLTKDQYVVSSPIQTRQANLFLIYFVPENIVNMTMDSYSARVVATSAIVLAVFVCCAIWSVFYLNRTRKKQFDSAIMTREHMFDLLVKNSRTAFGLFNVNQPKPTYLSVNSADVVGEELPSLHRTESGFELRSNGSPETSAFRQINESMQGWDGKTLFRSGFVLNSKSLPPNYFEVQLLPINDESGEYVGIAQDVTLLHERETAIKNALEMAEQANRAKTQFLSSMSHDIRTPMNAIVNMTDFSIEDMNQPEKLGEHLKAIRESADHLLLLINDILDTSRIESGKTVIQSAPFDLVAELERIQAIVSPLCAAKEQTFLTSFEGIHTAGVLGDQLKVSQILMNLLSNAVKFTPQNGAVRFTAKEIPSMRENYVNIRFIVEDTGIGISKDFLSHIFEPFSREDVQRVSGIQGTGLGLSICHSYVTAMGGAIKCESEESGGSTFTVELFFEKSDAIPPVQAETAVWSADSFAGMRCLLCEDNLTNQRIAKTMLERLGFHVEVANDGREGLEMFEKSPPDYYDVIYMDIQMPIMDGYQATAEIRSCSHSQATGVPILAMTANVFIEDVEKAHIAGMDGHIGKPITTAAVANETNAVLRKKKGNPS